MVALIQQGRSCFFTGSAGCGKSLLLQFLVAESRLRLSVDQVAVTASTGVAAVLVGGTTLHRWAGIDKGEGTNQELLSKVHSKRGAVDSWRRARVLFIDEISMLSGELFSSLSWLGQSIRRSNQPFGGLQVVCCGDFLQLGPVNFIQYAFQVPEWISMYPREFCVVLRVIYRQTDAAFLRILDGIRLGRATPEQLAELNKCVRPFSTRDGIVSTKLFCTNSNVDELNRTELERLPSTSFTLAYSSIKSLLFSSLLNLSLPLSHQRSRNDSPHSILQWR